MDVMEESERPLSASEMLDLKTKIKQDPEVLVMLSVATVSSATSSFRGADVAKSELRSLLHHAAAGITHDIRLVEWMIQMGALYTQPTAHCRKEPDPRARTLPKAQLPNQMAVHSAAAVGHTDIVRLMLEADNFRDLNTRTYHMQKRWRTWRCGLGTTNCSPCSSLLARIFVSKTDEEEVFLI